MPTDADLLWAARQTAARAYCPHSGFRVGAAVAHGDALVTGCNIENASYGMTVCAERVAIFAAVAGGLRRIEALAVTCLDAGADSPAEYKMPCGACRQVMAEFADERTRIIVDGVGVFTMADLLPRPFKL